MKNILLTLLLLSLPNAVVAQLPVEPGSTGNRVTVVLLNTHDRLPLQAWVNPASLPSFITRWEAPANRAVPDLAWPGQSSKVDFIFDVDAAATPGAVEDVVLRVERAVGDSTLIPMPLAVVPPEPLGADVEVIFSADMAGTGASGASTVDARVDDTLLVGLADDGVAPDAAAGDGIWTGATIFSAGTLPWHRYELELDASSECDSLITPEQRVFRVEDLIYDATGSPQPLPTATYGLCTVVSAPPIGAESVASLASNRPNPFGAATVFAWAQTKAGRVELSLFDLRGRRVSHPLMPTEYLAGEHILNWSPQADDGGRLAAGVYILRLLVDGAAVDSRRILLVR